MTLKKMQQFTLSRGENTIDELWVTQHKSIFTHGISSTDDNILMANNIPTVRTDRGGQITYHAEGQIIIYLLLDLKKLGLGVKKIIDLIEEAIIDLLKIYHINSHRIKKKPGIYVDNKKIAALGLKIKNYKTYHGLSLNVDMDLSPFDYINPCGYQGLQVCQMKEFNKKLNLKQIEKELCKQLILKI